MYCRKCGSHLRENAKFCDHCGESIVVIKPKGNMWKYGKQEKIKEEKLKSLKNPYVIPAIITAVIAFGLGIFPWPKSWQIGTSFWMKLTILVIALLSDYHCTKSKQVNRLYQIQYSYEIMPRALKTAAILAIITTFAATFSIIFI